MDDIKIFKYNFSRSPVNKHGVKGAFEIVEIKWSKGLPWRISNNLISIPLTLGCNMLTLIYRAWSAKKQFRIYKADVSQFFGESKYMFDLICSQLSLQWRLWHDGDADGFCRQQWLRGRRHQGASSSSSSSPPSSSLATLKTPRCSYERQRKFKKNTFSSSSRSGRVPVTKKNNALATENI